MATKKTTKAAETKAVETKAVETKAAAPAKKPARKPAVKSTVTVQFAGKEFKTADIVESVKAAYTGEAPIKTVDVYVKPEEGKAYYVVNGDVTGAVEL